MFQFSGFCCREQWPVVSGCLAFQGASEKVFGYRLRQGGENKI